MKPSWGFSLHGEGTDTLDLDVYDVIGEHWGEGVRAKDVRAALRSAQDAKTINLKLNTMGGDIFEGLAMFNGLKSHGARVVVEVDGIAASMGSILAMAGDEIVIPKSAWLMIHNPWGLGIGSSEELRNHADLLDKQRDTLVEIYADRTGQKRDDIRKWMDAETWMTGDEAKERGFATKTTSKQRSKAAMHALASARRFDFGNLPDAVAQVQEPANAPVSVPEAATTNGALFGAAPQPTPPPDGSAQPEPEPIERKASMEDKIDTNNTMTVARALALPVGCTEHDVLNRVQALREFEAYALSTTGTSSVDEARGAMRAHKEASDRLQKVEDKLSKVEAERDEQDFVSLVNEARSEGKMNTEQQRIAREQFDQAVNEGRGAQHVENLRGWVKAFPRIVPRAHKAPSSSAEMQMDWRGKSFEALTGGERSQLKNESPDLYDAMRSDAVDRGAV